MQNNSKNIIDFEDLFKEEIEKKQEQQDPEKKKSYIKSIIIYLLMMNVVVIFLFLILNQFAALKTTYSEEELILYNIASNTNAIAIIDSDDYALYEDYYADYINPIYTYIGYQILINENNTSAALLLSTAEDIPILDQTAFFNIFNGTTEFWDTDENEIMIIAGKNQVLPYYVTAELNYVEGPLTELSDFSYSFLNFLIYISMLPIIIIVLKRDIIGDWKVFKTLKNQWVIIAVVGYLYLMFGNVISGYLQQLLSVVLGVTPSESVNQLSIETSLQSSGAIFMVLSAVILGPIVEELIFRKAIFGLFKSDYAGLAVSTLAFGSIHLLSESSIASALVNGITYFIMGLIFGYIYIKNNRNLYAPLAVHIISNAVSVFMLLFIL